MIYDYCASGFFQNQSLLLKANSYPLPTTNPVRLQLSAVTIDSTNPLAVKAKGSGHGGIGLPQGEFARVRRGQQFPRAVLGRDDDPDQRASNVFIKELIIQ